MSTSWTGCTKLLGVRFTNLSVRQRGNMIARNQARRKRDVAALIHPAQGDDYREAVTDRLSRDTSIRKGITWMKYFASIGKSWWQLRPKDAQPFFFDANGGICLEEDLPVGVPARPPPPKPRPVSLILLGAPDIRRYAGWRVRDVLQEAVTVATAADEWMGNLVTASSRDVVPAPPVLSSSRRKVNC